MMRKSDIIRRPHLGNISYRLGQVARPADQAQSLLGDNSQVCRDSFDAEPSRGNLAAVGIPVDKLTYRLGRELKLDAQDREVRRRRGGRRAAHSPVPQAVCGAGTSMTAAESSCSGG